MNLRARSIIVLSAVAALWLASGTSREKPVLGARVAAIRPLEMAVAHHPDNAPLLRTLVQAYLDAQSPGLALGTLERAPVVLRGEPVLEHLYARALLDQGRVADALVIERRVIDRCVDRAGISLEAASERACDTWLLAAATRRAEILAELVIVGIDDANANPEASQVAYVNVMREAHFAMR